MKRRNNIRKQFALDKKDNVCKYVVRREIKRKDKTFYKSPKIQRLVTEKRLRRKASIKNATTNRYKATKAAAKKYESLLSMYVKEKRAQRKEANKAAETKWAPIFPTNLTVWTGSKALLTLVGLGIPVNPF